MTIMIQLSSYLFVIVTNLYVSCDDGIRLLDNFVVNLTKLQQFLLEFRQIEDDLMTIVIQLSSYAIVSVTNLNV